MSKYLVTYFSKGLGTHLLFQHLEDCHLLCMKPSKEKAIKNEQNQEQSKYQLTDFQDRILPNKPIHWVPYKSLEEAEKLNAVAPLSSALQTAQFACNSGKMPQLIYVQMHKTSLTVHHVS